MQLQQLGDIADKYACDKGRQGPTSRHSGHNYTDIYHAYLHPLRNEQIKLLEIGLGVIGPSCTPSIVSDPALGGASMRMWSDYLPNAQITGVDINPAPQLDTERVKTFVVDQGSRESLREFVDAHPDPMFDVIIDDGSHRADHQQISLEVLFPHLNPGGLYFIEDLNDFGYGGRTDGPYVTSGTLSTRDLFKGYARTGKVPEPNAFESSDFLAEIRDISFYCPRPLQRPRDLAIEVVRTGVGRARRGLVRTEWVADSEEMVVLRKAAA